MSSDVVYQAVRDYLTANWSTTPLAWENETFTRPQPTHPPAAPAAWGAVYVTGSSYDQASIGSGTPAGERWVEEGSVTIDCYVQARAGSLLPRQHATALAGLLKGLQLSGNIRFTTLAIGDGAPGVDDGNWWGLVLRADWIRG